MPLFSIRSFEHKLIFFPSGWAHYDTAKPGSMKLVPDAEVERRLRLDYEGMREMFFEEVEDFDSGMATIQELETLLNSAREAPANDGAPATTSQP